MLLQDVAQRLVRGFLATRSTDDFNGDIMGGKSHGLSLKDGPGVTQKKEKKVRTSKKRRRDLRLRALGYFDRSAFDPSEVAAAVGHLQPIVLAIQDA